MNTTFNHNIETIVSKNFEKDIQAVQPEIKLPTNVHTELHQDDIKSSRKKSSGGIHSSIIYSEKNKHNKNLDTEPHRECHNSINDVNGKDEITLVNILGLDEDFSKNNSWERKGVMYNKNLILGNANLPELSGQVKHGSTPINNPSQQTFSPQLPAPSPNYPVQSQVTQIIVEIPKENHKAHAGIVPIVNNNYISDILPTSQTCEESSMEVGKKLDGNILVDGHGITTDKNDIAMEKKEKTILKFQKQPHSEDNSYECRSGLYSGIENQLTILNIPRVLGPPFKRKILSKIDLAVMKKKMRRQKKVKKPKGSNRLIQNSENFTNQSEVDFYNSDSSSSSSSGDESDGELLEYDTWIKSGPPLKQACSPKKMCFLQIFGLTSHTMNNCKLFSIIQSKGFIPIHITLHYIHSTIIYKD